MHQQIEQPINGSPQYSIYMLHMRLNTCNFYTKYLTIERRELRVALKAYLRNIQTGYINSHAFRLAIFIQIHSDWRYIQTGYIHSDTFRLEIHSDGLHSFINIQMDYIHSDTFRPDNLFRRRPYLNQLSASCKLAAGLNVS